MSVYNIVKQLLALVICFVAVDVGISYWDDCSVHGHLIPTSAIFAGLSGVTLVLSIAVRPEIQLSFALYNCVTFLQYIRELYSISSISLPRCPDDLYFASVSFNVVILVFWVRHLINVLNYLKRRNAGPPAHEV